MANRQDARSTGEQATFAECTAFAEFAKFTAFAEFAEFAAFAEFAERPFYGVTGKMPVLRVYPFPIPYSPFPIPN